MPVNISADAGAPPRKAPRASSAGNSAASKKTAANEVALNGIAQIAGFALIMGGQYADAGAVGQHMPGIAHEVAVLADSNERVANAIGYLTEVGPYAGLMTAVMPLALQILANHNRIPADKVAAAGVVSPATLEAHVRTEMAQAEAFAMAQQREAEDQLARLQAEQNHVAPETMQEAYDNAGG